MKGLLKQSGMQKDGNCYYQEMLRLFANQDICENTWP